MIEKKIFVLGDSISIHYGPFLKKYLAKNITYYRKEGEAGNLDVASGANGGNSQNVLNYLLELKSNKFHTNILLLNCGLHDIKRDYKTNTVVIPVAQYENNIRSIVATASEICDTIYWMTTTHVDDEIHRKINKDFYRLEADVLLYNSVATSIMLSHHIPILDLYSFTKQLPLPHFIDHVHFTDEIRDQQGKFIAQFLNESNKS